MAWLTGKRRRALGIALLLALPMTCGVLFGTHLVQPRSEMDILRAMPTYPGARDVNYRLAAKLADSDPLINQLNVLTYRVSDPPEAVLDFYKMKYIGDGAADQFPNLRTLAVQRTENVFTGFQLEDRPPWIGAQYRPVACDARISAEEIVRNGEKFTEVTVELSTRSRSRP